MTITLECGCSIRTDPVNGCWISWCEPETGTEIKRNPLHKLPAGGWPGLLMSMLEHAYERDYDDGMFPVGVDVEP